MASTASASRAPSRNENPPFPLEGGCDCKHIRYRMTTSPLIVHACHCLWCQRESGSAFAMNASIEADRVVHLGGAEPERSSVPTESGAGQTFARCPECHVAVWSNYASPLFRSVRVGTLDEPWRCPPDVHIFAASKQPWMTLGDGKPVFEQFYEDKGKVWGRGSLERVEIVLENWRKDRVDGT